MALAAIVVAAVAVAAFFLAGRGGGEAAGGAAAAGGGGLEACGEGPAVLIVYAAGQEQLAQTMGKLLERQFQQALPNASFCYVEARRLGLEGMRVLPEILVRGNVSDPGLRRVLLNETVLEGFHPVAYDVAAMFAAQVGMQFGLGGPRYSVEARLVVVQGHTPVTRVNVSRIEGDERMLSIFSAVFAANITGVEEAEPGELGEEAVKALERLPNIAARSSVDLAEGTVNIFAAGDGLYAIRGGASGFLVNTGAAEAWERQGAPPELPGLDGYPSIGSGPVHIVVAEDLGCPYCAKFYNETMPFLERLAEEGRVTIHLVDLVIHRDLLGIHALLHCLYNETGNSTLYLELVKEAYQALLKAQEERNITLFQKALQAIEARVNETLGDTGCLREAQQAVLNMTHTLLNMGLSGTPSFIAWRDGGSFTVYAVGYRDRGFFEKLIAGLEG